MPYLSYQPRGCAESSRRERISKCRSSVFPRRIRRLWASRSYWRHGNRTDGCGSHPASAAGSSNRKNPVPASCENPLRTAQDDNRMPISTLSVPTARNRKAILNDVSASESRTVPSNDSRHANAHAPKSEHLVPRAVGPFADNPQRCLTSGDKGRPDVPCQATGLSPSQDEFSETHTEPINTRNIPVKQNGAAAMRRPPRNVSGGPQSADYPIRVSPCQLI